MDAIRKRRSLLVVLSVLLALVGAVSVFAYVRGADARALAGSKPTSVLVVVKRIPAGTTVAATKAGGYLRTETVPSTARPADAETVLADPSGKQIALADVPAGQILLRGMFDIKTPSTGGLVIPAGKMAVSVALSTSAAVDSNVKAGSEVAVFDTYLTTDDVPGVVDGTDKPGAMPQPGTKAEDWATKLLVPRVQVLAVSSGDSSGGSGGGSGGAAAAVSGTGGTTVTLAVDQDEAQRLIQVTQSDHLYLALLTPTSSVAPGPGVDNAGKVGSLWPTPGASPSPGASTSAPTSAPTSSTSRPTGPPTPSAATPVASPVVGVSP